MADFTEVAERVWVARYAQFDVNVAVVGGADGLVVVDTHGTAAAAREVVEDVRALAQALASPSVRAVVNTHVHFDHTFGNATFADAFGPNLPIHAHETLPEDLPDDILAPTHTFSSVRVLDLGDRQIELVHPGRGHSRGDIVISVPDANVLLAGDLVEESAHPSYGPDSYPLEWPATLDVLHQLIRPDTLIVPGHGAPVDRDFVEDQRHDLGVIAETIRDLASRGVPVDQALEAGAWPWPAETLGDAVVRGYEHLPRGTRQLPLI